MNNDLRLLGLKVKDRVTGFSGVVVSICYDLFGCIQAVVSPVANDKNEIGDGRWFDVSRLEVLDENHVMEIPGGRFNVSRTEARQQPTEASGPAAKPSTSGVAQSARR